MKKLLSIALVLALLSVGCALAEDYTTMTDEELWAANKAIQAELWARSIAKDGVTIPMGSYVVGEDIPAGIYRIEIPEGGIMVTVSVYENDEKSILSGKMYILTSGDPAIGKIDLSQYKYFETTSNVIIKVYTGLFN